MDAVLGLSVTPSAVGLVLVQGQDADGATMDREAFEVGLRGRSSAMQTCEQAAAAVLRSEALAATHGHRLHSIGVTWSDDANTEASLLLKSLTDSGFDNVVPVRMPEATEALARGIAEVIGYDTTAVCVLEPQTVIALIVHMGDGAVQTSVNHRIETENDLIRWLSTLFTRADWQPQALVIVGSGGDDDLMPVLEDALSVPVFAPAEAQLALARGAALASTQNVDLGFADDAHEFSRNTPEVQRRRQLRQAGPLAVLVAGVLTFTVSASVAISLQLAPRRDAAAPEPQRSAKTSPAALTQAQAPALPSPPSSHAAPVQAAPAEPGPPPVYSEQPGQIPEAAATEVPPAEAVTPDAATAPSPPEGAPAPTPPDGAPAQPGAPAQGAPAQGAPAPGAPGQPPAPTDQLSSPVPPTPTERPGIMARIRDRLHGIRDDGTPQASDAAPAQAPASSPTDAPQQPQQPQQPPQQPPPG